MGRPPAEGIQVKIRVREQTLKRLDQVASLNGWPVNREISTRLERSLQEDDHLGGPEQAALLRLCSALMTAIDTRLGTHWLEDWRGWRAVQLGIDALLKQYEPEPPEEWSAPQTESAVNDLTEFAAQTAGNPFGEGERARLIEIAQRMKGAMQAESPEGQAETVVRDAARGITLPPRKKR